MLPMTQTALPARLLATATAIAMLAPGTIGCGSPMKSVRTPASAPLAPDSTSKERVPAGTQVPIAVTQPISSRDIDSKEPEVSREQGFVVAEDVRGKAGVVLISKGTPVVAQVMRKLHERLGREGKITIRFQSTTARNGTTVKLSDAPIRFSGKKRLAGVIVGAILVPLGLLFLLLQGGDVTLESGSGLTATVVD